MNIGNEHNLKYKPRAKVTMHHTGRRAGLSKFAIPVAVIVILVAAGAFVFLTRSSTPPTSQSSGSSSLPTVPLATEVSQLVKEITNRNVDGVVTFYAQNSVVVWSGNTGGLVGQYDGPGNVRLIYAASIGKTTQLSANVSDYKEDVFSPTHVNATFLVTLHGNSTTIGTLNATVGVSEEWNWGNGGWHISKENWRYKAFDASLLDLQLGSATTFPQWGYMEKGGNPNLVSEKSFEWHAGSFLAVGVYGFLFSIAAVLAVRLKSRNGGPQSA